MYEKSFANIAEDRQYYFCTILESAKRVTPNHDSGLKWDVSLKVKSYYNKLLYCFEKKTRNNGRKNRKKNYLNIHTKVQRDGCTNETIMFVSRSNKRDIDWRAQEYIFNSSSPRHRL